MKNDDANLLVRSIIASNIRMLRTSIGYSQTQFAKMICVNRSYINRIEKGKMNVSVDILVKIADGLDVPLTRLFDGLEGTAPRNLPNEPVYAVVALPPASP